MAVRSYEHWGEHIAVASQKDSMPAISLTIIPGMKWIILNTLTDHPLNNLHTVVSTASSQCYKLELLMSGLTL